MNTMRVEIIENALPKHLLNAVVASWPEPSWQYWHRYKSDTSDKYGSMDRCRLPYAVQAALDSLAESLGPWLPDDCFWDHDCHAAGMHMIPPGGFLGRHLDAVRHPQRPWRRRFSVVCNVNSEWRNEWGGSLVIDGRESITPRPGTAILFETADCWHQVARVSHDAEFRKTLALFAWTSAENESGHTSAKFI